MELILGDKGTENPGYLETKDIIFVFMEFAIFRAHVPLFWPKKFNQLNYNQNLIAIKNYICFYSLWKKNYSLWHLAFVNFISCIWEMDLDIEFNQSDT